MCFVRSRQVRIMWILSQALSHYYNAQCTSLNCVPPMCTTLFVSTFTGERSQLGSVCISLLSLHSQLHCGKNSLLCQNCAESPYVNTDHKGCIFHLVVGLVYVAAARVVKTWHHHTQLLNTNTFSCHLCGRNRLYLGVQMII